MREHAGVGREEAAELVASFNQQSRYDTRRQRPFGLFDPAGHRIAGGYPGNLPPIPYFDKPFAMRLEVMPGRPPARCIAARLSEARVALQCQNTRDLDHFDEELLHALLSAGVLTLSAGLLGAVLIGVGAMRRLDAVTESIRSIVAGDLSRRLPVHKRNDDLDRLVRVVNGMLDEIERLMHEVKGVCDAIAHDLRTPLTRLIASLERAQRRTMTEAEYRTTIDDVITEAIGIQRTFNAMLRISEIESGARRENFAGVDLAFVAADVFEFYEPAAEERMLSFTLHRDEAASFEMQGDANLLFEAVANLTENAIKFARAGGHVQLELFRDIEGMGIRVIDDGPGITPEEREAVLRRFYRGEASRHTPGSGLGLSLVNAVAGMHGMVVRFEDAQRGCRIALIRYAEASR
ncbi:sensor histidine kinase [Paraburkholderia piptadeniae]|uniref:sensor histidine kinase n=1 Tax=Paraburkholderia piptadeniae TaxID=1701573 RepID=UPI001F3D817E|nr:ATP-binding protein [Paraburkholderia piptadeniae]